MKLLVQVGIVIALTVSLMAFFFLPKSRATDFLPLLKLQKLVIQQDEISKWLRRGRISIELFIGIHLAFLFAVGLVTIQNALGRSEIPFLTPFWMMLFPYSVCYLRNKTYCQKVSEDVEEALRLSYLLEKSGTDSRKVNSYLAQDIKGPLKPYLVEISAANALNVDLVKAYQKLKEEFRDIRAVVNYCNINIQKIITGKTGSLYRQQLGQIVSLKMERFKMKRMANRVKLCLFAVLLAISLLSITVYPMLVDTYKSFIGSMSN